MSSKIIQYESDFLKHWLTLFLFFTVVHGYAWHEIHVDIAAYPSIVLKSLGSNSIGAIVPALVLALIAANRYVRYACFALLAYAVSANIVSILEDSSNLNIAQASIFFQQDFLADWMLNKQVILQAIVLFVVLIGISEIIQKRRFTSKTSTKIRVVLLLFIIIGQIIKVQSPYPEWTYRNPMTENLANIIAKDVSLTPTIYQHVSMPKEFEPFYARDVSGKRILAPKPKSNVLMIVLEDTSQDAVNKDWMPYIKQLSKERIAYPNLMVINAKSTHGIYTLMCGDYPYFSIRNYDSWDRAHGTHQKCLPSVLKANGYKTLFMIAHEMTFGHMNRLVDPMGFDVVMGQSDFTDKDIYNDMGLDDASFARNVITQINAMPKDQPWFIMANFMGTHYSYALPPGYGKDFPSRIIAAHAYADEHIKRLLDTLKQQGILENTLVLITSEEPRLRYRSKGYSDFSGNRGLMIVLEPTNQTLTIPDNFLLSDTMLSILDYLDIPAENAIGRSIFRHYDKPRDLIFANILRYVMFRLHSENGAITQCNIKNWDCLSLTPDTAQHTIFGTQFTVGEETPQNTAFMKQFLEYNDRLRVDWDTVKRMTEHYENKKP